MSLPADRFGGLRKTDPALGPAGVLDFRSEEILGSKLRGVDAFEAEVGCKNRRPAGIGALEDRGSVAIAHSLGGPFLPGPIGMNELDALKRFGDHAAVRPGVSDYGAPDRSRDPFGPREARPTGARRRAGKLCERHACASANARRWSRCLQSAPAAHIANHQAGVSLICNEEVRTSA